MTAIGWVQIILFFAVVLAVTKPLGAYMFRVFEGERQPLPRVFGRFERFTYRLCGVDPAHAQTWPVYAFSLLAFSFFGVLVTYAIERLQHVLPWNPQHLAAVEPALAIASVWVVEKVAFPDASRCDVNSAAPAMS